MNTRVVFTLSVVLNLGLAGYLWVLPDSTPPRVDTVGQSPRKQAGKATVQTVTNTREVALAGKTHRQDWRTVESPDFKEYIVRLRAIGCPEETIRDIIIADINKLYSARWKSMMKPSEGIHYWDPWDANADYYERNITVQRQAMEKEKRELVRELLGISLDREMQKQQFHLSPTDHMETMLSFLSPEKLDRIREIKDQVSEKSREIRARMGAPRPYTADESRELRSMREWEEAELKKLLTPLEYDQYQVRASDLAFGLRSQLRGFDPTEAEYLAIFRAHSDMQRGFGVPTLDEMRNPDLMRQRMETQQRAQAILAEQLGAKRYADYQRGQDPYYRQMQDFVTGQNLSKDVANQTYEIKRLAEQQVMKLRTDATLSDEARQAALQAVQKETQASLSRLLGDEAYNRYSTTSGAWIQSIGIPHRPPVPAISK